MNQISFILRIFTHYAIFVIILDALVIVKLQYFYIDFYNFVQNWFFQVISFTIVILFSGLGIFLIILIIHYYDDISPINVESIFVNNENKMLSYKDGWIPYILLIVLINTIIIQGAFLVDNNYHMFSPSYKRNLIEFDDTIMMYKTYDEENTHYIIGTNEEGMIITQYLQTTDYIMIENPSNFSNYMPVTTGFKTVLSSNYFKIDDSFIDLNLIKILYYNSTFGSEYDVDFFYYSEVKPDINKEEQLTNIQQLDFGRYRVFYNISIENDSDFDLTTRNTYIAFELDPRMQKVLHVNYYEDGILVQDSSHNYSEKYGYFIPDLDVKSKKSISVSFEIIGNQG